MCMVGRDPVLATRRLGLYSVPARDDPVRAQRTPGRIVRGGRRRGTPSRGSRDAGRQGGSVIDGGLSTRAADTLLTERAADYLAGGPAPARDLVARVCQLPGVPDVVAEHM